MCGISAIVSLRSGGQNGGHQRQRLERAMQESLDLIKHRGPDYQGIWISDNQRIGSKSPIPISSRRRIGTADQKAGQSSATTDSLSTTLVLMAISPSTVMMGRYMPLSTENCTTTKTSSGISLNQLNIDSLVIATRRLSSHYIRPMDMDSSSTCEENSHYVSTMKRKICSSPLEIGTVSSPFFGQYRTKDFWLLPR